MEAEKTLPHGRVFEKEIFGVTDEDPVPQSPRLSRSSFDSSMQAVILSNWIMFATALETKADYCHNPVRPKMGKTGLLWRSVKRYLPRRVGGYSVPLNLYVAIGRNSLDYYYGVDAFFWWQGSYVTIDVSLLKKGGEGLKADFVLNPEDLEPEKLSMLGMNIAKLLKEKHSHVKHKKKTRFADVELDLCPGDV